MIRSKKYTQISFIFMPETSSSIFNKLKFLRRAGKVGGNIKCKKVSETQNVLRNAIRKKKINHPPPQLSIQSE